MSVYFTVEERTVLLSIEQLMHQDMHSDVFQGTRRWLGHEAQAAAMARAIVKLRSDDALVPPPDKIEELAQLEAKKNAKARSVIEAEGRKVSGIVLTPAAAVLESIESVEEESVSLTEPVHEAPSKYQNVRKGKKRR